MVWACICGMNMDAGCDTRFTFLQHTPRLGDGIRFSELVIRYFGSGRTGSWYSWYAIPGTWYAIPGIPGTWYCTQEDRVMPALAGCMPVMIEDVGRSRP